jgi:glycosyltransferase involved in cell wall biosynthesis
MLSLAITRTSRIGLCGVVIAVVLAVWDGYVAGLISVALASLRGQDVAVPIVVVDNASDVELPDLPDAQVIRSPRRLSLGAARNLGLDHVRTPYVIFWDADDEMLPGTLGFLQDAIGADQDLVAFGASIVEDVSGSRHRWPRHWMPALARWPKLFALIDCVWSLYPSTGATIMKTESARGAGGYGDAESGEDWCLGVSLAFRGRIGWSERPGRIYSLDEGSVWARHMTARHQLHHARNVRLRIREDSGIPRWARSGLPLIALAQYAAIGAHVLVAELRALRR